LTIMRGAEPFYLPGGRHGVLLIHGLTGSPSEMRLLGEYLNQRGFAALGPRLAGHGTRAEDMVKVGWPHWYEAVEDGYHLLRGVCETIAVVGLSMGGLLAFKLASEYPVVKIVSLNTPIFLSDNRLRLLPLYSIFRTFVPKKRRQLDVEPEYNVGYDCWPLSSLSSLLELVKHVDNLLPEVKLPAMIMQSRREHTVRPESALHIYNRLGSTEKQLLWWERSGHVITLDIEHEQVFESIAKFLTGKEPID